MSQENNLTTEQTVRPSPLSFPLWVLLFLSLLMGSLIGYLAIGSLVWWQWCIATFVFLITLFVGPFFNARFFQREHDSRQLLAYLCLIFVLAGILLGLLAVQPGILIGKLEGNFSATWLLFFLLIPFIVGLLAAFALAGSTTRRWAILYGLIAWSGVALVIIPVTVLTVTAARNEVRLTGAANIVYDFAAGMGISLTYIATFCGLILALLGALVSYQLHSWLASRLWSTAHSPLN